MRDANVELSESFCTIDKMLMIRTHSMFRIDGSFDNYRWMKQVLAKSGYICGRLSVLSFQINVVPRNRVTVAGSPSRCKQL